MEDRSCCGCMSRVLLDCIRNIYKEGEKGRLARVGERMEEKGKWEGRLMEWRGMRGENVAEA